MTIAPILEQLLAQLPAQDQLDYASLAEAMYKVRFTGPTVIHWRNGLPQQVDLGAPIRLSIVQGQPSRVDKPTRDGSG